MTGCLPPQRLISTSPDVVVGQTSRATAKLSPRLPSSGAQGGIPARSANGLRRPLSPRSCDAAAIAAWERQCAEVATPAHASPADRFDLLQTLLRAPTERLNVTIFASLEAMLDFADGPSQGRALPREDPILSFVNFLLPRLGAWQQALGLPAPSAAALRGSRAFLRRPNANPPELIGALAQAAMHLERIGWARTQAVAAHGPSRGEEMVAWPGDELGGQAGGSIARFGQTFRALFVEGDPTPGQWQSCQAWLQDPTNWRSWRRQLRERAAVREGQSFAGDMANALQQAGRLGPELGEAMFAGMRAAVYAAPADLTPVRAALWRWLDAADLPPLTNPISVAHLCSLCDAMIAEDPLLARALWEKLLRWRATAWAPAGLSDRCHAALRRCDGYRSRAAQTAAYRQLAEGYAGTHKPPKRYLREVEAWLAGSAWHEAPWPATGEPPYELDGTYGSVLAARLVQRCAKFAPDLVCMLLTRLADDWRPLPATTKAAIQAAQAALHSCHRNEFLRMVLPLLGCRHDGLRRALWPLLASLMPHNFQAAAIGKLIETLGNKAYDGAEESATFLDILTNCIKAGEGRYLTAGKEASRVLKSLPAQSWSNRLDAKAHALAALTSVGSIEDRQAALAGLQVLCGCCGPAGAAPCTPKAALHLLEALDSWRIRAVFSTPQGSEELKVRVLTAGIAAGLRRGVHGATGGETWALVEMLGWQQGACQAFDRLLRDSAALGLSARALLMRGFGRVPWDFAEDELETTLLDDSADGKSAVRGHRANPTPTDVYRAHKEQLIADFAGVASGDEIIALLDER